VNAAAQGQPRIYLAKERARALQGRHPWVFSGSVARVTREPAHGETVEVVTHDGHFVARGLFNAHSQIRVRLYTWSEQDAELDGDFWTRRINEAVSARAALGFLKPDEACRLVFSEADGLSGLTVDRYGAWLSVQFTSRALWAHREVLLDALDAALSGHDLHVLGSVLRTEKGILEQEGLDVSDGPLRGVPPPGPVPYLENGLVFSADLRTGQKTGAYLDQRENRARAAILARNRRVADVCCYAGGFTLPMLAAGARSVTAVDVSEGALEMARANAERNGLDDGRVRFEASDAFRWLEREAEAFRTYDMVVLDPPRFARSSRGVPQALKGYGRLNELAVRVLEPGGTLVTCSCTGRVGRDQFVQVLAGVEERTGRRIRILASHGQPADHPVSPTCPETAYLECLVCRVE
jgi:23S rRNA (cytosine1962-C5)-methyltransferase